MKQKKENLRVQWTGINFPEIYEWLIEGSTTRNFRLRVLDPGNKNSSVQITIDDCKLLLKIGDWIIQEESFYFIEKK